MECSCLLSCPCGFAWSVPGTAGALMGPLGPHWLGPSGLPWALMGRAVVGTPWALMGRALVSGLGACGHPQALVGSPGPLRAPLGSFWPALVGPSGPLRARPL